MPIARTSIDSCYFDVGQHVTHMACACVDWLAAAAPPATGTVSTSATATVVSIRIFFMGLLLLGLVLLARCVTPVLRVDGGLSSQNADHK